MQIKSLALCCAFMCCMVSIMAQSFSLSTDLGVPVADGDTLVVSADSADFMVSTDLTLFNNSNQSKDVMVESVTLSLVNGALTNFNFGLMMYPPGTSLSTQPYTIPANSNTPSFRGNFYPYQTYGLSYIRYRFFDQNNSTDDIAVVIQYNISYTTSLAENEALLLSLFPNPVSDLLTLSVEGNNEIEVLGMYNSTGQQMSLPFTLTNGNSKQMDVGSFPPGVYFLLWKLPLDAVLQKSAVLIQPAN